jgi:isopenicillin N synthase-like dioxygenase
VDPNTPRNVLEQHFPEHTDSSLITIAPRSTLAALEMKRFDTGSWVCVEQHMADDQVAVFMGDAGAYLTANYFPSPIHRAGVERMLSLWTPSAAMRISAPFFLRASAATVLTPSDIAGPDCGLPALLVGDLDSNVKGVRDAMPWKRSLAYYSTMQYSM